jgi:hypothetical protein
VDLFDPDHGAGRRTAHSESYAGGVDDARAWPVNSHEESAMEKRDAVHAVYAESLVFETNFGVAENLAVQPGSEVTKRPQWIPAWTAAALILENVGVDDAAASPSVH